MARELSELKAGGLTFRGITRGGIETCLMVPELNVAFDVGRCPPGLMGYDKILVSHGHADHLGGLFYMLSSRGLQTCATPTVYFPAEIEAPLKRIHEAWCEIGDFDIQVKWSPVHPGDAFKISKDLQAIGIRSAHRVPSLAYLIQRSSQRLKPEYQGRAGPELGKLRKSGVSITESHVSDILCVTGDTKIELFLENEAIRKAKVLVHEVTSWDVEGDPSQTYHWGHTHIQDFIRHVEAFEGDALVLVHRSPKYSRAHAQQVIDTHFPAAIREKTHLFG